MKAYPRPKDLHRAQAVKAVSAGPALTPSKSMGTGTGLSGVSMRKINTRLMLLKQKWQVSKRRERGRWGAECSVMGRKHACPDATEPTLCTTPVSHCHYITNTQYH